MLTDEDDDLFMLVENYQKNGGVCEDVGSGEGAGPPILEVHIPSNLELDPNAWFSNEFTFSPYFTPATSDTASSDMSSSASSNKVITEVSDRVTVESCWDESTNSVDMTVHYFDVTPTSAGTLPWIALGFRSSDICAMTPVGGGNTPMVLITHSSAESAPVAHSGELVPEAKGMSPESFGAIYMSLVPLAESDGFSSVSVSAPMIDFAVGDSTIADEDTVSLSFKQIVEEKPDVSYFTYAIGAESQLGVHVTRGCFELTDFASCSKSSSGSSASNVSVSTGIQDLMPESSQKVSTRSDERENGGQKIVSALPLSFAVISIALML